MNGKGKGPNAGRNLPTYRDGHDYIDWRIEEQKQSEIKKTSAKWLNSDEFKEYVISDPDGWDRENWEYSFYKEKITKQEFEWRLYKSTVKFPSPK
jgi:hypothetical protein